MRYVMKYVQRTAYEWFPVGSAHVVQCCDCGLVHQLKFKTKKGLLHMMAYRKNRNTGQIRRHAGIKIIRKKK